MSDTSRHRDESIDEAVTPVRRPQSGGPPLRPERPTHARPRLPIVPVFVLAALAGVVGVFFYLPAWIEKQAEKAEPAADVVPVEPAVTEPGLNDEEIAALTARAEDLLAELLEQQQDLDERSAASWGDTTWSAYESAARRADDAFLAGDFQTAVAEYGSALTTGRALLARSRDIMAEALVAGDEALAAGDADHAASQFELVLAVEPQNARALAGLERAQKLPDVLAAMRLAESLKESGDLNAAARAYRDALAIDAAYAPARTALAEIESLIASSRFDRLITDGFAAIGGRRFDDAAELFDQALALRPGSEAARDGLEQAEQGKLLNAITMAEVRARAFERRELWDQAIARYREALAEDPTLSFAVEGLARSQARADLDAKLQALIDSPRLLLTEDVFEDATGLLDQARAVEEPGPRITDQTEQLAHLMELASTPLPVTLVSDGLTSVTIYRVGDFEPFMQTELVLKPGNYTAIGHRNGYRDVRETFSVLPGAANGPVSIICVEPI